jgi:hypothetical protein
LPFLQLLSRLDLLLTEVLADGMLPRPLVRGRPAFPRD